MDPDSSMLSSPSSHGDQDDTFVTIDEDGQDLFPDSSQARPQTPQNNHLNAAAPGELSPPRSQHHHPPASNQNLQANNNNDEDNDIAALPKRKTRKAGGAAADTGIPAGGEDSKWRAGSWKTKKAQDEMARAWENFVDKDFTCAAFPDPLGHKVLRRVSDGTSQQG